MARVYWYIFCNNELAILDSCQAELIEQLTPLFLRQIIIDTQEPGHAVVAELPKSCTHLLPMQPFRGILSQLPIHDMQNVIKAHFILLWDKLHQYCGACGKKTIHKLPLYERVCQDCDLSYFPRISPCIIVRIHQGEKLLMTRSRHFLPGVFGLVAGFVEPGESAEDAVHREVLEETGIEIKNLQYFGSQPWPFPDALMLAYTAEYQSGNLRIDTKELESGGWYKYQNLPGRPSNPHSMASMLIEDFIQNQNKLKSH
jgi:NAD+ diphosphatase